jgi:hypothetical protein
MRRRQMSSRCAAKPDEPDGLCDPQRSSFRNGPRGPGPSPMNTDPDN